MFLDSWDRPGEKRNVYLVRRYTCNSRIFEDLKMGSPRNTLPLTRLAHASQSFGVYLGKVVRPALGTTTVPCRGRSPTGGDTTPVSSVSCLDFGGGQSYRVSLVRNGDAPTFRAPRSSRQKGNVLYFGRGVGGSTAPLSRLRSFFPWENARVSGCPFGALEGHSGEYDGIC